MEGMTKPHRFIRFTPSPARLAAKSPQSVLGYSSCHTARRTIGVPAWDETAKRRTDWIRDDDPAHDMGRPAGLRKLRQPNFVARSGASDWRSVGKACIGDRARSLAAADAALASRPAQANRQCAEPMMQTSAIGRDQPGSQESCRNLDVLHPQDFDLLLPGGRAHADHVALESAHQRPCDRRDPADMAPAGIDLVDAHDLDRALFALGIGVGDGGAEKDLVGLGPLGRIDDLRALEPLAEEADAPVDLAQALLAVEIVAVLRAIAVGRRPRHDLHDLGPLLAHERAELLAQARETLGSHVVLGVGGQARDLFREIVVVFAVAFLGE